MNFIGWFTIGMLVGAAIGIAGFMMVSTALSHEKGRGRHEE